MEYEYQSTAFYWQWMDLLERNTDRLALAIAARRMAGAPMQKQLELFTPPDQEFAAVLCERNPKSV